MVGLDTKIVNLFTPDYQFLYTELSISANPIKQNVENGP